MFFYLKQLQIFGVIIIIILISFLKQLLSFIPSCFFTITKCETSLQLVFANLVEIICILEDFLKKMIFPCSMNTKYKV